MQNKTIVMCVLREGGEFNLEHVRLLKKQIPDLVCLGVDIPFTDTSWHGWWSKMDLFRPDITDDILYFDLDTVIVGDIEKYKNLKDSHFLEDFYYPNSAIGSGMMYIKNKDKAKVWTDWILRDPVKHMGIYRGDQDYLKQFFWYAKRWQREFPKEIISYKKHLKPELSHKFYEDGYKLQDANVVCFHGKPRPWDATDFWIERIYNR